jgi:hypothetical protein
MSGAALELAPSLAFDNGVTLQLSIENGFYRGIEQARLGEEIFLVAGRGNRPYCVTPEGIAYTQFRILDRSSKGDAITLDCEAIGHAAPLQQRVDLFSFPLLSPLSGFFTDKLRIHFRPRSLELGTESYHGFEVQYEWESTQREIHWLHESVALAPGGTAEGARVMAQNMSAKSCHLEEVLHLDTAYSTEEAYDMLCIQSPGRGGGSQIFDLVSGPRLAAVSFFESAVAHEKALKATCQKVKGEDFVTISDLHYGTLARHFSSAPRVVLATRYPSTTREEDINRWTAWYDYTGRLWRRELGIAETRAVPVLTLEGTGIGDIDPGTTYPELLKVWAQRIDWVVEQGFQAINLHTPEWIGAANQKTIVFGGNNCSPWEFKLSDFLGGEEGLRTFCDICHARGIKVFVWIAAHLQREAPIWKQHPEWIARTENQAVWDGLYGSIHSLSFVHGAAEWVLNDLKKVRAATGIDGVWFDSFANLACGVINWQSPGLEPNAPAILRFLGDLSAAGFEIMIEGMSQLGVSSWGNLRASEITGDETVLMNTSMRYFIKRDWLGDPAVDRGFYCRMLAARAPLGVWLEEFLGRSEPFPPPLPEWFAPMTRAFNRVSPRMATRRLVQGGALWLDDQGQPAAFFAFDALTKISGLEGSFQFIDLLTEEKQDTPKLNLRRDRIYEIRDVRLK